MTTLDEIRARTKSTENSQLRAMAGVRVVGPHAQASVDAARDAHALMLVVDAIRAKFENDAKQLQATSAQLSREALRPQPSKADKQAALEDAERYRHYSTWADSQQRQLETIIDSILNPKEDTPNE